MNVVGIGTHVVECLRIAQMIERHGELFIQRVFTEREIEFCSSRKAATQHYAARWAGKESVLRAVGTAWIRGISWRDIEILNDANGQPVALVTGDLEAICQQRGIVEIQVSVSHCRSHAVAYAMALGVMPMDGE